MSTPAAKSSVSPLADLERVLRQQIAAYRELVTLLDQHRAVLESMQLQPILEANKRQQQLRDRLAKLEQLRTAALRKAGGGTLGDVAAKHGAGGFTLLKLRRELKELADEVGTRSRVAANIAGGMLGHLNTAVRVLIEAAGEGGVYTKDGTPKLTGRRGVSLAA